MKKIEQTALLFSLLFFAACLGASSFTDLQEDPELLDVMQSYGVEGTMILSCEETGTTYFCNAKRAHTPLCPASTFKIANSIIALEKGVIKDQHEVIEWDGEMRFLEAWNRDQNLKSAFKSSCVWFYQELAKKIGLREYERYLDLLKYGNRLTGSHVTTFWLEGGGDLRITPLQQLDFLKRLHQKALPLSERTYAILQEIMLQEEGPDYALYSKTGSATRDWTGHGWYVGYLTLKDQTWFFVTDILMHGMEDLPKREAVTRALLKAKGIF